MWVLKPVMNPQNHALVPVKSLGVFLESLPINLSRGFCMKLTKLLHFLDDDSGDEWGVISPNWRPVIHAFGHISLKNDRKLR